MELLQINIIYYIYGVLKIYIILLNTSCLYLYGSYSNKTSSEDYALDGNLYDKLGRE